MNDFQKQTLIFHLMNAEPLYDDIKWIAMDDDGEWFGYTAQPIHSRHIEEWVSPNTGVEEIHCYLFTKDIGIPWNESLISVEELFKK